MEKWPAQVLMLVTDRTRCPDLPTAVAAAIEGGVNVVQLRERDLPAGELLALARHLRGICGHQALLLVNDRVDVALLAGADGVHLGGTGLPVSAVRGLLPPSFLVGRSIHSVNEARQAEQDGADYVVAGTIFPSTSHPDLTPTGAALLTNLKARLTIPVVAIGGVTAENAAECRAAGAAGIAAISALLDTDDPTAAARAFAPDPWPEPEAAEERP
jgi:thiamine-phosphate pyrophosphorylase